MIRLAYWVHQQIVLEPIQGISPGAGMGAQAALMIKYFFKSNAYRLDVVTLLAPYFHSFMTANDRQTGRGATVISTSLNRHLARYISKSGVICSSYPR
tara:strand:- start:1379 stop:1672 length:294 start_codon:yes stop_codon:yes gene_type:complete